MPFAWLVLVLLLIVELGVAYFSDRTVRAIPHANAFSDFVGGCFPVVHRFDRLARQPSALAFYLAFTTCTVLIKAWFFCRWLQSDMFANYHQLVISPLTYTVPSVGDFIRAADTNMEEAQKKRALTARERSLDSRLAWSVAILGFTVFVGFVVWFIIGWRIPVGGDVHKLEPSELVILGGGWRCWVTWSLGFMGVMGSLVAASYCILKDYVVWIFRFINMRMKKSQSRQRAGTE